MTTVRQLPMEGAFNCRDLGGFPTKDGKYTRWGKVFRADELNALSQSDLDYLAAIPLITIVDFRSEEEMKAALDRVPASVRQRYEYSINPGNLTAGADVLSQLADMDTSSVMKYINVMLVTDPSAIKRYKDFFALLQNEENIPLMFHCTAGKDRTGMGAALFLSALGVDEETIMQDYLSSNTYLANKYGKMIEQYPDLKPLFSVSAEYLGAALQKIKEEYTSVENYLKEVLDVDIEKMKALYLV